MKSVAGWLGFIGLGVGVACLVPVSRAQTEGEARLEVTLRDYNGSGTKHWTVVWVTTSSGAFIKTLWKQGPSLTSSHWNSHCSTWYSAKAGSTALDGYTSATASNYSGTNSPVICRWNGRNAADAVMPDGEYKFWVQYAEDSGQGPYTAGGLLWTKGLATATHTYPNQGANFASLRVTWTPSAPPTVPPTITSAPPPSPATVGVAYRFVATATGTAPIAFRATGLPPGLTLSEQGVFAGTPTAAGTFHGVLTAANGTPPDATQAFSLLVHLVPLRLTSVRLDASGLVLGGTGAEGGSYTVLEANALADGSTAWTPVATNAIERGGTLSLTNAFVPGAPQRFYQLRSP